MFLNHIACPSSDQRDIFNRRTNFSSWIRLYPLQGGVMGSNVAFTENCLKPKEYAYLQVIHIESNMGMKPS